MKEEDLYYKHMAYEILKRDPDALNKIKKIMPQKPKTFTERLKTVPSLQEVINSAVKPFYGIAEGAGSVVGGMISSVPAMFAGLGKMGLDLAATGDVKKALKSYTETKRDVAKDLAWLSPEPQTKIGKTTKEILESPFALAGQAIEKLPEEYRDAAEFLLDAGLTGAGLLKGIKSRFFKTKEAAKAFEAEVIKDAKATGKDVNVAAFEKFAELYNMKKEGDYFSPEYDIEISDKVHRQLPPPEGGSDFQIPPRNLPPDAPSGVPVRNKPIKPFSGGAAAELTYEGNKLYFDDLFLKGAKKKEKVGGQKVKTKKDEIITDIEPIDEASIPATPSETIKPSEPFKSTETTETSKSESSSYPEGLEHLYKYDEKLVKAKVKELLKQKEKISSVVDKFKYKDRLPKYEDIYHKNKYTVPEAKEIYKRVEGEIPEWLLDMESAFIKSKELETAYGEIYPAFMPHNEFSELIQKKKGFENRSYPERANILLETDEKHRVAINEALEKGLLAQEEYNKLHSEMYGKFGSEEFKRNFPDIKIPEHLKNDDIVSKVKDESDSSVMPQDAEEEFLKRFRYKPETISSSGWEKIKKQNIDAFNKYKEIASKYSTPEEFINHLIKDVELPDSTIKKIKQQMIAGSDLPYFDYFKTTMLPAEIVLRDWDTNIITPSRVENAGILQHGRNFPDGFSGIMIKKDPYENKWIVNIKDGEHGGVFYKVYNNSPTKKQVLYDAMVDKFLPDHLSIGDLYPEIRQDNTLNIKQITKSINYKPSKELEKARKEYENISKKIEELNKEFYKKYKEANDLASKEFNRLKKENPNISDDEFDKLQNKYEYLHKPISKKYYEAIDERDELVKKYNLEEFLENKSDNILSDESDSSVISQTEVEPISIKTEKYLNYSTGKERTRKIVYSIKQDPTKIKRYQLVKEEFLDGELKNSYIIDEATSVNELRQPFDSDFFDAQKYYGKGLEWKLQKDAVNEFEKQVEGLKQEIEYIKVKANEAFGKEIKKIEKNKKITEEEKNKKINNIKEKMLNEYKPKIDDAEKNLEELIKNKEKFIQDYIKRKSKNILKDERGSFIVPDGVAESVEILKDSLYKIVEDFKKPEEFTVQYALKAMIENYRNLRDAEWRAMELERNFEKLNVPAESQRLITLALDNPSKYYKLLSPEEINLYYFFDNIRKSVTNWALEIGILDEVKHENYIFHWVKNKEGEPYSPMYGKHTPSAPQLKPRKHETIDDLTAAGHEMVTYNPATLIAISIKSLARAAHNKILYDRLLSLDIEYEGKITRILKSRPEKPLKAIASWQDVVENGLQNIYERYHFPYLERFKMKAKDNKVTFYQTDIGVYKPLYPYVKAYLENPEYGNLSKLHFMWKSINLMSTFHIWALMTQAMIGGVSKKSSMPIVNIIDGWRKLHSYDENLHILHNNGLELMDYHDLQYVDAISSLKQSKNKLVRTVGNIMSAMSDLTFKVVHPAIKVSVVTTVFERMKANYESTVGRPLTPEELNMIARKAVKYGDDLFSGEDYKLAVLETNLFMAKHYYAPNARKTMQNIFISPQWQLTHLRAGAKVFKSFTIERKSAESSLYRRYFYATVTAYGILNLLNWITTKEMDGEGKFMWQNDGGNIFAVRMPWNEPDGRKAYVRPLKSAFEIAELVFDFGHKAFAKLSPALRTITEVYTRLDERVARALDKEPIEHSPKSALDVALIILEQFTPFWGEKVFGKEGKALSPQSKALSFLGFPVSKNESLTKLKREREDMIKIGNYKRAMELQREIIRLENEGRDFYNRNKRERRERELERIRRLREEYEE